MLVCVCVCCWCLEVIAIDSIGSATMDYVDVSVGMYVCLARVRIAIFFLSTAFQMQFVAI